MKKLLSVISIVLLILVIGSVSSLATELNTTGDGNEAESNTVQIGSSSNTNKAKNSTNTNKTSKNTNVTADNEVETNVVGSTNSNKANTNTNTNKTSNTSQYNSTTNSSKLPYAGTGTTSIALVAIAFVGSAVYAYKKVSDYNI